MIKHIIWGKNGEQKKVELTPLKAIRLHCLQCVCWTAYEVKNCTSPRCPLYPFRLGKAPGHKGKGNAENLMKK